MGSDSTRKTYSESVWLPGEDEVIGADPIPFSFADTEIDWSTYMQQVELFINGERNYSLVKGNTGPIVCGFAFTDPMCGTTPDLAIFCLASYPAWFLYIYTALYQITNQGKDLRIAQYIFAQLYVVTLAMVFALYKRCGSVGPVHVSPNDFKLMISELCRFHRMPLC